MESAPQEGEQDGERAPQPVPRIWVGSLLDYTNGLLYGDWLDVIGDADELTTQVHNLLAGSPTAAQTGEAAEEWGIFDSEGFGELRVGEYTPLATIASWASGIREHGLGYAAWVALDDSRDADPGGFADDYLGQYETVEAYAETLIADLGIERDLRAVVPDWLQPYVRVDYEGVAHDLLLSGDVSAVYHEGKVWLFRNQ